MIRLYHHPADDLTSLSEVLAVFPSTLTQYAPTTEARLIPDARITPGRCLAVIDGEGNL